ncbi:MAG: excinuclease ABC subunit UvrB [Candidatus Pacebacteria bacterium]|nr:excinuclease ABC subunit UvrB [Candidatus Paceibacterota bacterium]
MKFKLQAKFKPDGDQPVAIEKLYQGLKKGSQHQTLLGVTGSGKTFTVANVIEKIQKPTLVIAHNKTLAAQLVSEFREFFPDNAVEYFVSYYDYYQPEAYMSSTDTYIEKEVQINKEIEKLRHKATAELLSRKDVIVVASVSCIYGLGSPDAYRNEVLFISTGLSSNREKIISQLVDMHYSRSEVLERGRFRARGDVIEIIPPGIENIIRIELSGETVKRITEFDGLTRKKIKEHSDFMFFPAKHFIVEDGLLEKSLGRIEKELKEKLKVFQKEGKLLEADRLKRRTKYDLEMIREVGYCNGIENYSRYLTGRKKGDPPYTLMDYFPKDYLVVIDESHVTIPQIRAMHAGDKARKTNLVDHGFRLPSAFDNRPLRFDEFEERVNNVIYISATPADYEKEISSQIVEQIIRPTGLVDSEINVRPIENQVDDLSKEIEIRAKKKERILVTTLTKKMAEDLDEYLRDMGIKSNYLHSEVDTLDRIRILEDLRRGKFDCLVGVNLLREGLDLPEVTLVGILDADKEGFLRSETSLIQTIGRAARNVSGKVIMYADNMTGSMKRAIDETNRRRKKQVAYNKIHNITPATIQKKIKSIINHEIESKVSEEYLKIESFENIPKIIKMKEREMRKFSQDLKFEQAAMLRDEILELRKLEKRF